MGNYSCGCADYIKDDHTLNYTARLEQEEIVEFHPELYKHPSRSLVTAVELPSHNDKSHSPLNSIHSTSNCEVAVEMQGELFRYQKTSKEILVPRWCILTQQSFQYFKNYYSALCKEKYLFEVLTDKVLSVKAYCRAGRYFIEISFMKNEAAMVSCSSVSSFSGGYAGGSSRKHCKSLSSARDSEETLVFVVPAQQEWEKWQKTLRICIGLKD